MRILFVFELIRFTLENIFLTSGMESELSKSAIMENAALEPGSNYSTIQSI